MTTSSNKRSSRKRIIIIGGGFGGAYAAQALERRCRAEDVDIWLLDRNNYFIFYPLLVEAGTGSLEPRHAVVSIRSFLKRAHFRMAEVMGLDAANRRVSYRMAGAEEVERAEYDQLVIALGSVTNLPDIPGLREHGYEVKSLTDTVALRDRAIQMLEWADACEDEERRRRLLHFVVVGGNFTGAEVAGEFQSFMRQASRYYPNVRAAECRMTLIDIADRILPALDPDLSEYAKRVMERRGMQVLLKTSINEVHADHVVLSDETSLPASTTIWCAGIAPSPLIGSMGLPVDQRGYIECERDLRVRGIDNIWAIGDCAVNPDREGLAYPATAQHAVQQANHLVRNLKLVLNDNPTLPCDIVTKGTLAALGCRTAVAKIYGFKLSGFLAWWMWRSVYLMKMPGWSRKIRVILDWTMDLFFRRDFVQLGVHRTRERSRSGALSN